MALEHDDGFMNAGPETDDFKLPEDLDFGNDVGDDVDAEDDADEQLDKAADDTDQDADDGGDDSDPDSDDESTDADGDDAEDTDEGSDDGEDEGGESEDEEGEDEGEGDDAKKPALKDKKSEPRIPKSRLDQALRKQRLAEQRAQEVERELAELRRAQAEASRPKPLSAEEIKAKMAEANEALVAGDTEKAAAIQAELFEAMTPATSEPVEEPERDLVAEIESRIEFKHAIKDVYSRFPELDDGGDEFDEELGAEAVDLMHSYVRRGYTPAEAAVKAAEGVAKLHDLVDRKAPAPEPEPAKSNGGQKLRDAKTKQKISKATKAPPVLDGKNSKTDEQPLDINRMSEEEFMALPESVRNKLLGASL